ncbi:MAG: DNA-directed RNA polymerase subunit P [Candidatus Korarchaeota archaeon]
MAEEEFMEAFANIVYKCMRCGMELSLADILEGKTIMTGAIQCTNCDYPMLYKIRRVVRRLKAI